MKYALAGAALLAVLYFAIIRPRKTIDQQRSLSGDGSYSYPQANPTPIQGGYSNPSSVGAIINSATSVVDDVSAALRTVGPFGAQTRGAYGAVTPPPPTTAESINTIDHADAYPPSLPPPAVAPSYGYRVPTIGQPTALQASLASPAYVATLQPSTGPALSTRSGRGHF